MPQPTLAQLRAKTPGRVSRPAPADGPVHPSTQVTWFDENPEAFARVQGSRTDIALEDRRQVTAWRRAATALPFPKDIELRPGDVVVGTRLSGPLAGKTLLLGEVQHPPYVVHVYRPPAERALVENEVDRRLIQSVFARSLRVFAVYRDGRTIATTKAYNTHDTVISPEYPTLPVAKSIAEIVAEEGPYVLCTVRAPLLEQLANWEQFLRQRTVPTQRARQLDVPVHRKFIRKRVWALEAFTKRYAKHIEAGWRKLGDVTDPSAPWALHRDGMVAKVAYTTVPDATNGWCWVVAVGNTLRHGPVVYSADWRALDAIEREMERIQVIEGYREGVLAARSPHMRAPHA